MLQLLKLPDGTVKVLVEGGARARIVEFRENPAFFEARAEKMEEDEGDTDELEALSRSVAGQFEQYVKLNKKVPPEVLVSVNQIEEPSKLADTIASHLSIKLEEKQELLEIGSVGGRLERVISLMEGEDRSASGGEAHPLARQASDGEDAARVLPERADEGDPKGAGRRRGRTRRGGRV